MSKSIKYKNLAKTSNTQFQSKNDQIVNNFKQTKKIQKRDEYRQKLKKVQRINLRERAFVNFQKQIIIKLNQKQQASFIGLTYDDSCIIQIRIQEDNYKNFYHFNNKNQIQSKFIIQKNYFIDKCIINEQQMIIIFYDKIKNLYGINKWNFRHKKQTILSFPSMNNKDISEYTIQLIFFQKSQLICIIEHGYISKRKNIVKLSYFDLFLTNNQPIYTYETHQKQQGEFIKLNNYSILGYLREMRVKNTLKIQIILYSYNKQNKECQIHKISQTFSIQLPKICLHLVDIWQICASRLFLQFKIQQKTQRSSQDQISRQSSNFSWDYKQNTVKNYIFDPPYMHTVQFVNSPRNFSNQQLDNKLILQLQKGQFDQVQRTLNLTTPNSDQALLNYIENYGYYYNQFGGLSRKQKFQFSNNKLICIQYQHRTIILRYRNLPVNWNIYSVGQRVVTAFMLIQFYLGNCDEDLIYSIVNLIGDEVFD